MEKILEFEFEGGGSLRLEFLGDGRLLVRLQATHPGEGLKVTSTSVAVDPGKVEVIRAWLAQRSDE